MCGREEEVGLMERLVHKDPMEHGENLVGIPFCLD